MLILLTLTIFTILFIAGVAITMNDAQVLHEEDVYVEVDSNGRYKKLHDVE
ncbi:hypothetical protein [Desertivirga brevis]|uniref:hypothetical protein n=1 Tax=Desertivirga brevis TaxID=2810310 RepID=UPI001A96C6EE|nr:hypothetical protein [Pedobacter sp. SYSU D00873]